MTREPPVLSIITPAFRAGAYISETIESALMQDFTDFEHIVVDDCSPDDTCAVVSAYARRDARVRLIKRVRNGGPAAARNSGLEASTGRFVAFLDSDDLWRAGKLRVQLEHMQRVGAAISFTAFRRIDETGALVSGLVSVPAKLDYAALLKNTAIATSTVVVDRQQTGPFQLVDTFYDDYALWLELTRRGFDAVGIQEDLMRYRVRRASWSRNKLRSALWVWRTYRDVEKIPLGRALWSFGHWAANAMRKYSRWGSW